MLKKDLAVMLGISAAMVSKLAARGMPTHSIDAAKRWRDDNLSLSYTKRFRAPPVRRRPDPVAAADAINLRLRDAFGTRAWLHRDELVDDLRCAMRSIPVERRHELALTLCCWDALIGRLPTLVEIDAEECVADDHPWFEYAAG